MNLPPSRRLASFVEPDVDDKRIDRTWAAVSSRPLRAWPSWRGAVVPGVVFAAAAAVLLLVVRARTPASALAGLVIESGVGQTVTLSEGSRATLRDGARLRWDRIQTDRVEATVERGQVAFDVHHNDARAFVVHAAGVDVFDRGTRFMVDVEGSAVSVSVEEGRIEIARAGAQPVSLTGGEAWKSGPTAAIETPVGASASSTVTGAPAAPPTIATEVSNPAPEARTSLSAEPPAKTAPPESHAITAQELLQKADEARLAGHPKEAAASFDILRRRFRNDPRAGLAAFELSRLRLDSLGDPAGAAEALADAIALAPTAPFREDADARLVEAFDRMHDVPRCTSARRAYLTRYPNGLHASAVAARCP
jgi:transmembrane sensor